MWSRIAIIALILGTGVFIWYQLTAAQCPVPLSYRIGEIDQSFGESEAELLTYIERATQVWEEPIDRDLFVYDEDAHFTINFVYDERQATTDAESLDRAALDAKQAENEAILSQLETLEAEYTDLQSTHQSRVSRYQTDLAAYNERVRSYNDRGGAPSGVFAELEAERERLESVASALEAEARELNQLAEQINDLAAEGNRLIASYNRDVERYNENYGYSREFTQGDYQGDRINIYSFADEAELVRVLAHEFGHALGIGHIEGESSVMYYLMEETSDVPILSAQDREAAYDVCGVTESWAQKFRHLLRQVYYSIV